MPRHILTVEDSVKGGKAKALAIHERKRIRAAHLQEIDTKLEDAQLQVAEHAAARLRGLVDKSIDIIDEMMEAEGKKFARPKVALDAALAVLDRTIGKPGQEITLKDKRPPAFLFESDAVTYATKLGQVLDKGEEILELEPGE